MPIKLDEEVYFSVEELVAILPLTALTIRDYLRRGKLKGKKVGKLWYVSKRNLKSFLEGNIKQDL
ncbi:helix-turn-helix domain-containing protein [Candidatus Atribacteria bacterium 1244-E10-H5-B2]|nr:MAG: helix-turn-helix domain-containing protein [Candidatus Atribacteria bacterium 1244-E10-H5-B2]